MYKQIRHGIQESIKINPSFVNVEHIQESMIDNGFGILIPDPNGIKVVERIKCRISYQKKSTDGNIKAPVGLSTNLSQYILTDYRTPICTGDRFNNYEILEVQPLTREGKIVGYQAELKEAI